MRLDIYATDREKAEDLGLIKVLRGETQNGKAYAMLWRPKAKKPYANYIFGTIERREEYIREQLDIAKGRQIMKEQQKAIRKGTPEMLEKIKPGTIFLWSWGYDQTNLDFYQVVSRDGQMVNIREIAQETVKGSTYSHGMADMRTAIKDAFLKDAPIIRKRLQFTNDGRAYLTMDSFGWCEEWNGEPHYCSWYH